MAWRLDRLITGAILTGLGLPLAAGLLGTLGQASAPGAVARLFDWPGLGRSIGISVISGLGSTVLATLLSMLIVGALAGTRGFGLLRRTLAPLLALPHAAAALGLAFLFAPAGWISRAVATLATGWSVPPDVLMLNDPLGLSLAMGLAAKETPFLLLMALAAWPHCDAPRRLALVQGLGHGRLAGFVFAVLPDLARQLRLPIHAVLAYGLTSADMGQVLGPTLPPPLAVQILRWSQSPLPENQPLAAAAAVLLLGVVILAILACEGAARLFGRWIRHLAALGYRGAGLDLPGRLLARIAALGMVMGLVAGLSGLILWSFAELWPYPQVLPQVLTLQTWRAFGPDLFHAAGLSLALGLASSLAALAFSVALLELLPRRGAWFTATVYLPLILPQIVLMPGLVQAMIGLGGGLGWPSVLLGHLIFVLPYVLLSLTEPWTALDPRLMTTAASLGASPGRILWRVRLPMLLPALASAAAVGFAVSIGQYLPTLLLSGGRVATLTTEALALSSGGNRRLAGAHAVLQIVLPGLAFGLATAVPRLIFARRKAMLAP